MSVQSRSVVRQSNNSTHIWYEGYMTNFKASADYSTDAINRDPVASFIDPRPAPILSNPSEYYLSVARFDVPTTDIPIRVMEVETGQADPNKTIFAVSLSYANNDDDTPTWTATRNIVWRPEITNAPTPAQPITQQDTTSAYYYMYSYKHFATLIQEALQGALFDLKALATPYLADMPTIYFEFDPNTKCFNLYAPTAYCDTGSTNSPVSIIFNQNLFSLLSSFPTTFQYGNGLLANTLQITSGVGNAVAINDTSYVKVEQEYSQLVNLNSFQSIMITTNMGIQEEFLPPQGQFGVGNVQTTPITSNNSEKILSSMVPSLASGFEWKAGSISYQPSQYRFIDMLDTNALRNINLQFYWTDRFGRAFPLRLYNCTTINFMLLFRRKDAIGV